jgi:hypothetical protein
MCRARPRALGAPTSFARRYRARRDIMKCAYDSVFKDRGSVPTVSATASAAARRLLQTAGGEKLILTAYFVKKESLGVTIYFVRPLRQGFEALPETSATPLRASRCERRSPKRGAVSSAAERGGKDFLSLFFSSSRRPCFASGPSARRRMHGQSYPQLAHGKLLKLRPLLDAVEHHPAGRERRKVLAAPGMSKFFFGRLDESFFEPRNRA